MGRRNVHSGDRTVYVCDPSKNSSFISNKVITSKYTVLTFLPLILWNHITRFMNLYFIIIGSLQMWKDVSPVDPLTTWIPIFVIFAIAFTREGFDDYKQHKIDAKTNGRRYEVSQKDKFSRLRSDQIRVGDRIKVRRNTEFPADVVILYAHDPEETCPIETANLDGETNLKHRFPLKFSQALNTRAFNGKIECIPPNSELYNFSGNFYYNNETFTLTRDNFVQCGAFLRNIEYVIGVVVYTGPDTKLYQNSVKPLVKWTKIERFFDKISIGIFIVQWVVALITGTIASLWARDHRDDLPYLQMDAFRTIDWFIFYVRFYLLSSMMIPISLKVTIDVSKTVYGLLIGHDAKMIDSDRLLPATVNNSSVVEDLGGIEYVFSDKTGTLTENQMVLKKMFIGDKMFGHSRMADNIIYDQTLMPAIAQDDNVKKAIEVLALCHTAKMAEGEVIATSPEEGAFLNGLISLGFSIEQQGKRFTISTLNMVYPRTSFEILNILPFTYERKRMSVIVKCLADDSIYLLSKGAGEVISSKCSFVNPSFSENMLMFASLGLRVMGLSFKPLDDDVYDKFSQNLQDAQRDLQNRQILEERVYEGIEEGSVLLGCAAIEDRLQEGVAETIALLRDSNIRVWMLTGDIMQTALKIAFSTGLVTPDGPLISLTPGKGTSPESVLEAADKIAFQNSVFYLAIQGTGLDEIINHPIFKRLVEKAKCVILARSTPSQKASIVSLLQSLGKQTLAIGDGGNDVQMIRAANVGVGIIGIEGMQAAAAADFSISHFRFLQRLLIIHGRQSAYRTSWLCQFCFYKSTLLVLIQILFFFYNGYSGVSFFNSFNLMCYNAIFTVLPVIFFLLDRDLEEGTVMLNPRVYEDSQKERFCNLRTLAWWYIKGIYQGLIIIFLAFKIFDYQYSEVYDGSSISLDEVQQVVYTAVIFIVCLTVTFDTRHFTIFNLVFIWGSWVLYILFACIASEVPSVGMVKEMWSVMWRVIGSPIMWVTVMTLVSAAVIPPFLIDSLIAIRVPSLTQRLMNLEIERKAKGKGFIVSSRKAEDERNLNLATTIWEEDKGLWRPVGKALQSVCCC